MVDIDKAIIARLEKAGEVFEILVDCDLAMNFKAGKDVSLNDVLASEDIYSDAKQAEHASEHVMQKVFGTEDTTKIAEEILKKGEVQLTAEYKNKLREQKRKKIVNIINHNGVDPKTGNPHPAQRIELAMDEAKVKIDEFKSAEEQVQTILHQINAIIPIKFEVRELSIKIPAQFAGPAYGPVKKFGKILRDDWQSDGSLIMVLEIPAGMQEDLEDELNRLTHGEIEFRVLNRR